jgi:hypothetical protein
MNRTPQRRAGPGLERGAELRSDVKNRNSNHLGRPRPVCTLTGGDESGAPMNRPPQARAFSEGRGLRVQGETPPPTMDPNRRR